jgi:energy-coupling factor transporter ATP-binding protein EcfA2
MAHPKEHLVRRHVRLARLDVIGWFSSGQLAGLFERALVERRQDDPSAGRVEIYAMDAEADGWEPPVRWDEAIWFSSRTFERVLAARNLRGFYHHDAPSWQFYDRATAIGVQTLPAPLAMPPWESSAPLRSFLHWAYAAAGLRLTHAATLGLNGRGVLLAGPSGSGKSATTLAGLLNGLDSVGDDYVLLETGDRVSAYPVFTMLKQDREGLRRAGLALADLGTARLNWRGKMEFDAATVSGKPLVDRMEIAALLLPEIARARSTSLERVTPREAALTLTPSAVFQLPGDSTEGFQFFAGIVRRLPAYRARLSEDPAEIAGTIGAFLAKEGSGAG